MRNMKFWRTALVATLVLTVMLSVTGGTIAWFTDTVTTGENIIKAGNLDVKLEYKNKWSDAWEEVKADTKLFDEEALYEPGYTETLFLRVTNVGSLALKYKLGFDVENTTIGQSVLGNEIKLSNYMKIGAYAAPQYYSPSDDWSAMFGYMFANRESSVNTIGDRFVDLNENGTVNVVDYKQADGKDVVVLPGETNAMLIGVVLQMPTTVGNEANHVTDTEAPKMNVTLNLEATQAMAESDSFGSEYDQDAVVPEGTVWDGTIPAEQPAGLIVDAAAKTITINDAAALAYLNELNDEVTRKWEYTIELNADINLMNYAWTPVKIVGFKAFNGNNHTISNIKVKTNRNYAGLFSEIINNDSGATHVTNLNLVNVKVSGAQQVGALVGYGAQAVIDHVTVTNATVIGTKYVGGISGHSGVITNSTVADSSISVLAASEGGQKEAGGLMGYTANDGEDNSPDKVISGNTVKNTVITAPTIASGLVSQTSAAYGNIVFQNNKLENVTVKTADETAALYVSNPVVSTYATNVDETNTADAECKVMSNAGV